MRNDPYPTVVAPLDHGLTPFFEEIQQFSSTRAWLNSSLYARLMPDVEKLLGTVVGENFAPSGPFSNSSIRVTAWNIERGIQLDNVIRVMKEHPLIRGSDIFLLTELDHGMIRTRNRHVAREIASAMKLNYAFAPSYLNLNKGSGLEEGVPGENAEALHGNALFSRHPLREAHAISLPNGKDKMKGNEKRLGCQKAVVAVIDHPMGPVRGVSLHMDAHSSQGHRHRQMQQVLDHLSDLDPLPVLIGGDWNTSTYNSKRATYAIVGFWRRVLMGVERAITKHYPHPDRWFERHLFRELSGRGFYYRNLNEPGVCTLHYNVLDAAVNSNLGNWVPGWCFKFIDWALKDHQGRCSFKLDWFAGKGITPVADFPPRVVGDLQETYGPLSDHDPIILDFLPEIKYSSRSK